MVEKIQATLQVLGDLMLSLMPLAVLSLMDAWKRRRGLRADRKETRWRGLKADRDG